MAKCKFCPYESRKDNVVAHENSKHLGIKSICECGGSFSTSSALRRHKKNHCRLTKEDESVNDVENVPQKDSKGNVLKI